MAALRASLHAPSSLVCSAAESDNSLEDKLPFDENIPLAGNKEQDEEEDEKVSVIAIVLYSTKDTIKGSF